MAATRVAVTGVHELTGPVGRPAMAGQGPLDPADLVREAGVRPQL